MASRVHTLISLVNITITKKNTRRRTKLKFVIIITPSTMKTKLTKNFKEGIERLRTKQSFHHTDAVEMHLPKTQEVRKLGKVWLSSCKLHVYVFPQQYCFVKMYMDKKSMCGGMSFKIRVKSTKFLPSISLNHLNGCTK